MGMGKCLFEVDEYALMQLLFFFNSRHHNSHYAANIFGEKKGKTGIVSKNLSGIYSSLKTTELSRYIFYTSFLSA